tara:strand:+ start:3985 stop:4164 length:180 start_codon:yes stop_codon:yes gene_type:complete
LIKLHGNEITLLTLEQRESINATTGVFAKQKIEKMAIGLRGWKGRLVDIFDRPTFGRGE